MRSSTLRFGLLLLGGLLLCNCAGAAAKRRAAKEKPEGTGAGNASNQSPAWQTRLGRVVLVNSGLGFVLIDAGTAPAPEPGTRLRAYDGKELSGELAVSIHQQRPFLIADIVSGNPRVGDMAVPVKSASKQGEVRLVSPDAADTLQKEQRGNSAAPGSPSKPAVEGPDTGALPQIERRPPPAIQSLLSPNRPAEDDSQAIIPGLPSPGRNTPR